MENRTIRQSVLKPGGTLDSNRDPEYIQIFNVSGEPVDFESIPSTKDIPAEGTFVLKVVDGVLGWVSE